MLINIEDINVEVKSEKIPVRIYTSEEGEKSLMIKYL